MVDAKNTILKAATPIICATLFLSTIIGGVLQYAATQRTPVCN